MPGWFSPCCKFPRTWPSDYTGFHVITYEIYYSTQMYEDKIHLHIWRTNCWHNNDVKIEWAHKCGITSQSTLPFTCSGHIHLFVMIWWLDLCVIEEIRCNFCGCKGNFLCFLELSSSIVVSPGCSFNLWIVE